jgi:hypothetical protein
MNELTARLLLATLAFFMTACSILMPAPVNPGDSEADVIAKRGQPTHSYQDGKHRLLEYTTGPMGQQTYMARIDENGKVISFEQVLTTEKFATIKLNESTKSDVLRIVGAPGETSYLSLSDLEVWSYTYKRDVIWNSIMHVHFDKAGVVRKMFYLPDLRYDPDPPFDMRGL